MRRGRYAILLLSLLPLWLAAAGSLPVRFEGARSFDKETLLEAIGIETPRFYQFWKKAPRFPLDRLHTLTDTLEGFYKSHGFYHTRVNTDVRSDALVIHIQEGPPVLVESVSVVSPVAVEKFVPFKKGERFDSEKFVESKKAILTLYKNRRYCNVLLDAKAFIDIEQNKAYLVYDVTPGDTCVFGPVTIETPDNIEKKIVASMLYFREGEPYTTEMIQRSYKEIYAHPGVESVVIDDSGRDGNKVPVYVKVTAYPKPVHLSTGLGYDSDQGVTLKATLEHRNFFGNLRRAALAVRYTQILAYARLMYDRPISYRRNFHGYIEKRREIFDGYEERTLRTRLELTRREYPRLYRASVFFDRITTRDSEDPVNFPNGTVTLVSPMAGLEIDTRDSVLDPTSGYQLQLFAAGSLKTDLTDATYYKLKGYITWHTLLDDNIFAAKIHAGSIRVYDGRLPPSYRFYAGGMSSNRAYSYRKLGPRNRFGDVIGSDSILEGTAELRAPLSRYFRGVLFCDVTWLGDGPLPDFHKTHLTLGTGIRYMSPMGPIALDVGFDVEHLSQFAIHFHIGELF